PTGVVADTRGRRISFLLSEATLAVGTLAYVGVPAIHGGLLLFCLAGVSLGLGDTFDSGAVEAWLGDARQAAGYRHEPRGGIALVRRLTTPGLRRPSFPSGAADVSFATIVATGVFRSFWISVPVSLVAALPGGVLEPVRQASHRRSTPYSEPA